MMSEHLYWNKSDLPTQLLLLKSNLFNYVGGFNLCEYGIQGELNQLQVKNDQNMY